MIVSIDIGTSYSSICYLGPDGKIQPVDISTGTSMFGNSYSLPSAVFAEEDGEIELGQAAYNDRIRIPQNFRDEFKRNLGENIPIWLGEQKFLPEELYTLFFRHMKACAEKVGGESVERAYITYPAAYGKNKKDKIVAAAKAAGLFVIELIDEPTAAAMSYLAAGYAKENQNVLVYDFGGGTFDVSLVRYENGEFKLLGTPKGLERCGGIDMDRMIYRDMMNRIDQETLQRLQENQVYFMRFAGQLAEMAVKVKHHLSTAEEFKGHIAVGFDTVPYELSRERFNQMIAKLVGQTIQTCRDSLQDAGLGVCDLSAILLVGGTSRVPLAQQMVKQMAGGAVPVYSAPNMELAVAQGALEFQQIKARMDCDAWYHKGNALAAENQWTEAVYWFKKAADQGHGEALNSLGICCYNGKGTERNKDEAIRYFKMAADQDNANGQYDLAVCYYNGDGVPQNYPEAVRLFRGAAAQEHDGAAYMLGNCYYYGEGVSTDKIQGMDWYREAAERGHADAQVALGLCYHSEYGRPVNYREALKWFHRAAAQKHSQAQYNIGMCYYHGWGEEINHQEAVTWFRAAAQNGSGEAQYKLGCCFESGDGVSKDLKEAKKWFQLAAGQGNELAAQALKQFKFKLV